MPLNIGTVAGRRHGPNGSFEGSQVPLTWPSLPAFLLINPHSGNSPRAEPAERIGAQFVIDAAAGRLEAAVDGEPDVLETPLEFRVEPRALRVLVPKAQSG